MRDKEPNSPKKRKVETRNHALSEIKNFGACPLTRERSVVNKMYVCLCLPVEMRSNRGELLRLLPASGAGRITYV